MSTHKMRKSTFYGEFLFIIFKVYLKFFLLESNYFYQNSWVPKMWKSTCLGEYVFTITFILRWFHFIQSDFILISKKAPNKKKYITDWAVDMCINFSGVTDFFFYHSFYHSFFGSCFRSTQNFKNAMPMAK